MLEKPDGQLKSQNVPVLVIVGIVAALVAVVVVRNSGPSTIRWETSGPVPHKGGVGEAPGPEHCEQQDQTFLTVWGGKDMHETWGSVPLTFVPSEADATLPPGATFTGWHSGERELWADWSVPPTQVLGGGGSTKLGAVYIVSPSGVERWARYDLLCI